MSHVFFSAGCTSSVSLVHAAYLIVRHCRGGTAGSAAASGVAVRILKSPSKLGATTGGSAGALSGAIGSSSGATPAAAAPSPNRMPSTGRGGRAGSRGPAESGPQSVARGEFLGGFVLGQGDRTPIFNRKFTTH